MKADDSDFSPRSMAELVFDLESHKTELEHQNRELLLAKKELEESEEKFRVLFNIGKDAIFAHWISPEGKLGNFFEVNNMACERLGYSREELLNMNPSQVIEKKNPEESRRIIGSLLNQKEVVFQDEHKTRSGKTVFVEVNAHLFVYQGNLAVISIARDITDRLNLMKREKMLLQQAKLISMGEMIGAIAHQWRQPLNSLGLLIQDIDELYQTGNLNRKNLTQDVAEGLELIKFMSRTIDNFRNFFNPEKEKVLFDLKDAMGEILFLIHPQLKNSGIDLKLKCHCGKTSKITDQTLELPFCFSHSMNVFSHLNEFKQVMLNLIGNGRDAILDQGFKDKDAKPEILISLLKNPKTYRIMVEDSGTGLSEEVVERLFEPYFTTKEEGQGTGIGLYMSKMIIESHMGGKIYGENREETSGARFVVELPMEDK